MKKSILLCISILFGIQCLAQNQITGIVFDAVTDEPLPGATVQMKGTYYATFSDFEGLFSLVKLPPDTCELQISYIGYRTRTIFLMPSLSDTVKILLSPKTYVSEEVSITATRAAPNSAMTYTELDKTDIEKQNLGQDLPFLLNFSPSVVSTSDAGAGIGYTGIRIRGSDQTRINVTINGIPLNDAESQNVFWVDLPDFASSVENIQIQRGVGTSSNGAGAFGGSINILTNALSTESYAQVNQGFGSFNTVKSNLQFGSGLIDDKYVFEGRMSKITSDGYIDKAFSDLKSFYLSAGRFGKRSLLKVNVFSGKEKTFQAWYGIPQDSLKSNPTYNVVDYDNEIDDYQQDHYQLHYTYTVNSNINLHGALHYTKGQGFFEQFRTDDALSNYSITAPIVGGDTISNSDLIRRRWLDNDFFGMVYSANYDSKNNFNVSLGGAFNRYEGQHFGEVIWARYAGNSQIRQRYYDNDAIKTDMNSYIKATYEVISGLALFADIEYRRVAYEFDGFNETGSTERQSDDLGFLNPKFGLTYKIDNNKTIYFSYAKAHKEPSREDYTESSLVSRPRHEELDDFELGFQMKKRKYFLAANFYFMQYKDQLALSGKLNDVGAYTRTNIENSYRAGIEISSGVAILKNLNINGNVTLSRNKIENYTEYIDDYVLGVQLNRQYENTSIAFSPELIGALDISYRPVKACEVRLLTKHVGMQFLDNTSEDSRSLDAYTTNDLILSYGFKTSWIKRITARLAINNILDVNYASNGYTFAFAEDGVVSRENWVYPQAGINFLGQLTFDF